MSYRAWFQCINPQCGATYPLNSIVYQCTRCNSLLEVQHDLDQLKRRDARGWMKLFEDRYKTNQWPYGSGVWAKKEWVLSPTAEEVITTLAAAEINSYRQMPVNFYQVSVKFRDEIRPRFGLMRAKEFIMKDAYSFDVSDDAAMVSYRKMYEAYKRVFDRCGLKNFPVEADTGVIGGNYSHEFMVPAETGENEVAFCESCGYAANVEKATSGIPKTGRARRAQLPKNLPRLES